MKIEGEQIKNFVQMHLGSDQYRTYNVEVARKIGIEEAIILNELIDQHRFYSREDKLVVLTDQEGEWFYCDYVRFEERTAIQEKALMRVLKNLKEKGLITYVLKGIPPKRHFQINYEAIYDFLNNFYKTPKKELCSSQKGTMQFPKGNLAHIYNEPKKEPKTTTSPPPQKPPESKEPRAQVVVVSPIFSNLKISPSKKLYLQSMYTTPQIEKAVDRVKRWDSRRSDEAALEYALQNEDSWNDIITKNEMVEKNRQFCKRLAPFDMKQVGGMYCAISLHGVEFSNGNASKFFSIEEEGFTQSVEDFLLKCGVPIPIEGDL